MTKETYKTNKAVDTTINGSVLHVPEGTDCILVDGAGGGFAVADPVALGADPHDAKYRYAYIPKEAVNHVFCTLIRPPISKKSENWQETAYKWAVSLNGVPFEYYTGAGRVKKGKYNTDIPIKPTYDDVVYALLTDYCACEMSFDDFCSDFGYDTDSRKALQLYLDCQANGQKLLKARINIAKERERLADY